MQPSLTHYNLASGEYVDIIVSPIWHSSITNIKGNLTAKGSGITKQLYVDFSCKGNIYNVTLENPSLYFDLNSGFCINGAPIDDTFNLPSGFSSEDVVSARLIIELKVKSEQTTPYDVWIDLNGHRVGSILDTFPDGRYEFEIDKDFLNYATVGTSVNKVTLDTNMNEGTTQSYPR